MPRGHAVDEELKSRRIRETLSKSARFAAYNLSKYGRKQNLSDEERARRGNRLRIARLTDRRGLLYYKDPEWRRLQAERSSSTVCRQRKRLGPTALEYRLYRLLESAGFEFETEVRFGRYVVDAWVPERALVFEADGQFWYHHQDKEREAQRDAYLIEHGAVAVVHLSDVDLEGVN